MTDIIVKDEGEFATIIFLTEEAQLLANEENLPIYEPNCYKIDVGFNQVRKIIHFAELQHLVVDCELTDDQLNSDN